MSFACVLMAAAMLCTGHEGCAVFLMVLGCAYQASITFIEDTCA